ncbi:MAG: DUF2520 domain-containing protein [Corynebacteriales bacterium]|nr:DUF2520 domain-containing protein [Mycobacteriales bacterium]
MDTNSRPARLRVGIIGAGRVGSALGAALASVGHAVVAATAVSSGAKNRVRRRLPDVPLRPADEVIAEADLVLIAVPDDVLPELVGGLANYWKPGQLVAHVSGSHGLGVLEPALRAKALPFAIHPVMSFTGRDEDLERLNGISYGVTAPEPLRHVAQALVIEIGGEPVWIADELRPLYHAGLAVAANHLVTLIAEGADVLRAAGVQRPDVMLAPLVGAALDNGLRFGDAGLTGPVVRGDAETVAAHLAALNSKMPDAVAAYQAMARRTADRALGAGRLSATDAEALLEVLASRPHGASA